MSHEIYSAASGGMAAWRRMENISNNLANANTTGFKAQRFAASSFDEHVAGNTVVVRSVADLEKDGPVRQDDIGTHFALQGRGFFAVTEGEETLLVRRGDFALDTEGQLVDAAGRPVLGTSGPITIEPGTEFTVTSDGVMRDDSGGEIATLMVVDADEVLVRGEGTWNYTGELAPADASVTQGALEGSAVDPLGQMVELIAATRSFEALQKAMRTSDDLDGMANQMARGG